MLQKWTLPLLQKYLVFFSVFGIFFFNHILNYSWSSKLQYGFIFLWILMYLNIRKYFFSGVNIKQLTERGENCTLKYWSWSGLFCILLPLPISSNIEAYPPSPLVFLIGLWPIWNAFLSLEKIYIFIFS